MQEKSIRIVKSTLHSNGGVVATGIQNALSKNHTHLIYLQ